VGSGISGSSVEVGAGRARSGRVSSMSVSLFESGGGRCVRLVLTLIV
jgi:hypothetical protein